ncbi:MAG: glycine cleavage system protein GcvH [Thermodesulfovibrionales bacterium]|nr:glycine cleavage system protein GcvH [Thermodesulfovibrionales bacterium]
MNPEGIKYHKEHTWARIEGSMATVGITDFAQEALGDIVYIELPELGASVTAGESMSDIESAKATSPVISPVTGTVKEVNSALEDEPEMINPDPYGKGWIVVVEITGQGDLLDAAAYDAFLKEESQ